jgi:hypothetical protein
VRDLVLKRKHFVKIPVVLIAPDLFSAGGVEQIHMQTELILALPEPARKHRPYAKSATNRERISLFVLATCGTPP